MEMQSLKEKRKGRERERMRDRSRGGREGLNFNPRVTEFTDICTRIRLAVPHGFSERTLSLLSLPKTYSSSYICRRMRPFTVLGGRERGKTELYVLNSSDARVTIHKPRMSSRSLSYIVCILMDALTRGGGGKNDM